MGPFGPHIVYRPQTPRPSYFSRFHNFMDLFYDSGENEDLFVKFGTRVLDLKLDTSFGIKWP